MINCQTCKHNAKATKCKKNIERPFERYPQGLSIIFLKAECIEYEGKQ